MPDRENVIRALELCRYYPDPGQEKKWYHSCLKCPYCTDRNGMEMNCNQLYTDALALLREPSAWDVFETITTAFDGKQTFFRQDSGTVYDRYSGDYCTFDEAVQRFARRVAQWEN